MTDRVTTDTVIARCDNVNRRMESRGSTIRYSFEGRNGYIALDALKVADEPEPYMLRTVTVGTKREIADYLSAMIVALDDAAQR